MFIVVYYYCLLLKVHCDNMLQQMPLSCCCIVSDVIFSRVMLQKKRLCDSIHYTLAYLPLSVHVTNGALIYVSNVTQVTITLLFLQLANKFDTWSYESFAKWLISCKSGVYFSFNSSPLTM